MMIETAEGLNLNKFELNHGEKEINLAQDLASH